MNLIQNLAASVLPSPGYKLKLPAMFDFSHWETIPDWNKVYFPDGTAVLITKATDGKAYVDPSFVRNWEAFTHFPYPRGAYHWYQPNNVSEQIENYCSKMLANGWTPKDYPPIVDVEYEPPKEDRRKPDNWPRYSQYKYQVKFLLDGIEKRLGVRPVIYWSKKFTDLMGETVEWINDYWNFVAWYPDTAYVDTNPIIPASVLPRGLKREKIAGWQYRADWRIQGIPYDGVDVSVANPDFLATLHYEPPVVEPPALKQWAATVEAQTEDEMMIRVKR